MKDDDDDEEGGGGIGLTRYECMPSLVSLRIMRNRLHLAHLGKRLMKWSSMATARELRRIAMTLDGLYKDFSEEMRTAYILLARSRYFYPNLNHTVTEDPGKRAGVIVSTYVNHVSGARIVQYDVMETEYPPYPHLGIEKGGQIITETKKFWLELLKHLVIMLNNRSKFIIVETANKNSTKRWNILSKLVVPRILLTIRYISSELEEIEREDNFRLKRFKELKLKKAKKNEKKAEKKSDDCVCYEEPPCINVSPPVKKKDVKIKDESNVIDDDMSCVCTNISTTSIKADEKTIKAISPTQSETTISKDDSCVCISESSVSKPTDEWIKIKIIKSGSSEILDNKEKKESCVCISDKPATNVCDVCSKHSKTNLNTDGVGKTSSCVCAKDSSIGSIYIKTTKSPTSPTQGKNSKSSLKNTINTKKANSCVIMKDLPSTNDAKNKKVITVHCTKSKLGMNVINAIAKKKSCACSNKSVSKSSIGDTKMNKGKTLSCCNLPHEELSKGKQKVSAISCASCNKNISAKSVTDASTSNDNLNNISKQIENLLCLINDMKSQQLNNKEENNKCPCKLTESKASSTQITKSQSKTITCKEYEAQSKPSNNICAESRSKTGNMAKEMGYFETKFKETIKVKRIPNKAGVICEEKETKTEKTEKNIPYTPDLSINIGSTCSKLKIKDSKSATNTNKDNFFSKTSKTNSKTTTKCSKTETKKTSASKTCQCSSKTSIGQSKSKISNPCITKTSKANLSKCSLQPERTKSNKSIKKDKSGSCCKIKIIAKPENTDDKDNKDEIEVTTSTYTLLKNLFLSNMASLTQLTQSLYKVLTNKDSKNDCSTTALKKKPSKTKSRCSCQNLNSDKTKTLKEVKPCNSLPNVEAKKTCSCKNVNNTDSCSQKVNKPLKSNSCTSNFKPCNTPPCHCKKEHLKSTYNIPMKDVKILTDNINKWIDNLSKSNSLLMNDSCSCSKISKTPKAHDCGIKTPEKNETSRRSKVATNIRPLNKESRAKSQSKTETIKSRDKPNCKCQLGSMISINLSQNASTESYISLLSCSTKSIGNQTDQPSQTSCSLDPNPKGKSILKSCSKCKKCPERTFKKDATTSTRRSDRYDVRPLDMINSKGNVKGCYSDSYICNKNKQTCRPLTQSCSMCDSDCQYFRND